MKGKDKIMSILKSLTPIKYKFSRNNKELDKIFKTRSLHHLMKVINHHPKFHDELELPKDYLNNRDIQGINFKNSNEYIKELSDLNNLPLVVHNKNYLKNGKFNDEYNIEQLSNKNKEVKMRLLRLKEKRKKEKEKLKIFKLRKVEDSKVDSLKYNPNYDFIKRKIFSLHIRPPTVKKVKRIVIENERYNEKNNSNQNINQTQITNKNLNLNTNNIFLDKSKNDLHNNGNNNSSINSIMNPNSKDIFSNRNNNNSFIFNDSNTNLSNSSRLRFKSRNIPKIKIKIQNLKNRLTLLGKYSQANSDYNTVNKSTNIENISLFHKDSEKISRINSVGKIKVNKRVFLPIIDKNFKRPLKLRSKSNNEIKHCIDFRKMLARKGDLFLDKNLKLISYFPNYDCLRPHIPDTFFKIKKNEINYKKYKLGKIIRGYKYSPDKYFILEYEKDKKKLNQNREGKKIEFLK